MKEMTIREAAVLELYHTIDDYCSWYIEQGIYLPPGYEKDPSGWNEVLNQIKRAFTLLHDYKAETGQLWDARGNAEETKKLQEQICTGFELFGKYLFYLTDEIVDRGPAH